MELSKNLKLAINASLLAGKKSGILPIPVVVIPAGITNDSIDDLASRAD